MLYACIVGNLDFCRDTFEKYISQCTTMEFKGQFRVDHMLFEELLCALEKHFGGTHVRQVRKQGKRLIPLKFLLRGVLRWLAGADVHSIIYACGCRKSTWEKLRWIVLDALLEVFWEKEVVLPQTQEDFEKLSEEFSSKSNMEGFFGAVDGLLVHITLPVGSRSARPFHCYKKFYALNMQGVAGCNGEFLYANIGHTGGTCDGYAIRDSTFWKLMETGYSTFGNVVYKIFGDGAYALRPWLITPFDAREVALDARRDVFNLNLSRGRQVIERAFGMMISRFEF